MTRWPLLFLVPLAGCAAQAMPDRQDKPVAYRPKVAGELEVKLRLREKAADKGGWKVVEKSQRWNAHETAIIVCDMWDGHYCESSAQRVGVMVPRMNAVLTAARNHGVMIVHAPSGVLHMYAGSPHRARMQAAPRAEPPVPLLPVCNLDRDKEPPLPIADAKSPCDDPVVGPAVQRFSKQHPGLDITGFDGVSDDGQEMYNVFAHLGIRHVAIMGVHTNMCVMCRSFGIRQLKRIGMDVVLVRDLTDAMYDPREPPYVSHARGTELVVEHIEKYWCPSALGEDFVRVVPGTDGPK